jgi:hypothetical protein
MLVKLVCDGTGGLEVWGADWAKLELWNDRLIVVGTEEMVDDVEAFVAAIRAKK